MRTIYTLLIALLLTSCSNAQVKSTGVKEDLSLKYLVKEPAKSTATTPVIILLHGYGSNEADLFDLAGQLPPDAVVISARAPLTLGNNSFAWYPIDRANAGTEHAATVEKARQQILQFIDEVAKKYHTQAPHIYLMGFSQGAIMSLSIAMTQPDKIRGIAVMSGRLLEEIKPQITTADKINKVAIFIGHGTEDKVLPITDGRYEHSFLDNMKVKNEYHEYKMIHTISIEELSDIQKWLANLIK